MLDTDTESQQLRETPPDQSQRQLKKITLKRKQNWKNYVTRRIYILSWIRNYDKNLAISDFIAGITLGLTIIPQAIAYAALAGLPSQYGLYSAFVGNGILFFEMLLYVNL